MGNTQTRPSANTAIEYEEDRSLSKPLILEVDEPADVTFTI